MALAGYCGVCKQNVYLTEQWGCVSGHGWDQISGWYDPETGAAVTPYWLEPGYAEAQQPAAVQAAGPQPVAPQAPEPETVVPEATAPAAGTDRLSLLAAILEAFSAYPGYRVAYGTDTDVVIDNQVADASWATGKKKIEYSAVLKAVESKRTVYFWEALKESGGGLSFGGVGSESYSTFGTKRYGKRKDLIIGPGGVEMNAEWDYAATRRIVEATAEARGWRVKTVLRKGAATY